MQNLQTRYEELVRHYGQYAAKSATVAAILVECGNVLAGGGAMDDMDALERDLLRELERIERGE